MPSTPAALGNDPWWAKPHMLTQPVHMLMFDSLPSQVHCHFAQSVGLIKRGWLECPRTAHRPFSVRPSALNLCLCPFRSPAQQLQRQHPPELPLFFLVLLLLLSPGQLLPEQQQLQQREPRLQLVEELLPIRGCSQAQWVT